MGCNNEGCGGCGCGNATAYDVRGYANQEGFDSHEYTLIAEGKNVFDAFAIAGIALKEDFQIVKVQDEDREEITILRRDA